MLLRGSTYINVSLWFFIFLFKLILLAIVNVGEIKGISALMG